jgi:hypothetical protein
MTFMETAPGLSMLRAAHVCCAPGHDCGPLAEAVATRLGATLETGTPPAGGRLLLLYRDPVGCLVSAMAAGEASGPALERWQAGAREIAALRRANRARAPLLEVTALAGADAERLGMLGLWDGPLPAQAAPEDAALFVLVAADALRRSPSARRLAEELEASALPLPAPERLAPDPEAALAAIRRLQAPAAAPAPVPLGPDPVSAAQIALLEEELAQALDRLERASARADRAVAPVPATATGETEAMMQFWIETLEGELEALHAARN